MNAEYQDQDQVQQIQVHSCPRPAKPTSRSSQSKTRSSQARSSPAQVQPSPRQPSQSSQILGPTKTMFSLVQVKTSTSSPAKPSPRQDKSKTNPITVNTQYGPWCMPLHDWLLVNATLLFKFSLNCGNILSAHFVNIYYLTYQVSLPPCCLWIYMYSCYRASFSKQQYGLGE